MLTAREWCRRLWDCWRPTRSDADLAQELQSHLDLARERAERSGLSTADAVRETALQLGTATHSMDAVRDQRGLRWLEEATRDARYAVRALRRHPTFAAAALSTLAIAVGANTAVFSVVNSVLLRPLPYPAADRLVAVSHAAPGAPGLATVSGGLRLSLSMYVTYAEQNRTFDAIGLWAPSAMTVTGRGDPEDVAGVLVTDGTLQTLAVPPLAGRWLSAQDQLPGAVETVMLGYGYWQRRFGGDPSVVGRNLIVSSRPRQIVGVMPRGFRVVTAEPDLIVLGPLVRSRLILAGFGYNAIARLKRGVTIADANADVARLIPIWMRSWPTVPGGNPRVYEGWHITPAVHALKEDIVGSVRTALWTVMGTIALVLLIACANVANLMLVRTESRQPELAVRAALGAGTTRIVRVLLAESLWVGVVGGVLGVGLAALGLRVLTSVGPPMLPRLNEIALDVRALGFASVVSVGAGALFGIVPAVRYRHASIGSVLHGENRAASAGRHGHRLRNVLVVAQIALALVLLVCAGLMIRTADALRRVEPGFSRPDHLQLMRISIPGTLISEPDRVLRTQYDIVDRLAAIPGVTSVAFTSAMPMESLQPDWDAVLVEGRPVPPGQTPPLRWFKQISPDLFRTSGTRVIAGRDFTWTDLAERRNVVIVSENLARELWASPQRAIGKRLGTLDTLPWREVIGVVQDVHDKGNHEQAPTTVYWPARMESRYAAGQTDIVRSVTFVVRSDRAGTQDLLNQMQQAVWAVNANLPLASIQTMRDVAERSLARTSFTLVMLSIAGALALALGLIGIYGVMSYAVAERTRELGIRLALGASRRGLEWMVVGRGLLLVSVGAAIGVPVAAGTGRLMSSLLFGIAPHDPPTFLSVSLLLAATTAVASYLPARRAAMIDPVKALKSE